MNSCNNEIASVSVIVCTYNRSDLLKDSLKSLFKQTYNSDHYEIIVVDNNSTDATRNVVESLLAVSSVKTRYIFDSRQGLSFARNTGINHATGEIVVFTDDDVEVDSNWLTQTVAGFSAPDIACVGGPVRPLWLAERPAWLTDRWCGWLALYEFEWAKETCELKGPCYPVGANIAFRRSVFEQIGYFSPELGRVGTCLMSNEESRICAAIELSGLRIRLAPEAIVYHKIGRERLCKQWFFHRLYWQGRSDAVMYGRNSITRITNDQLLNLVATSEDTFSRRCYNKYLIGFCMELLSSPDHIGFKRLRSTYQLLQTMIDHSVKQLIKIHVYDNALLDQERVLSEQGEALLQSQKDINSIVNSVSWRLSAPFRRVLDRFVKKDRRRYT